MPPLTVAAAEPHPAPLPALHARLWGSHTAELLLSPAPTGSLGTNKPGWVPELHSAAPGTGAGAGEVL